MNEATIIKHHATSPNIGLVKIPHKTHHDKARITRDSDNSQRTYRIVLIQSSCILYQMNCILFFIIGKVINA